MKKRILFALTLTGLLFILVLMVTSGGGGCAIAAQMLQGTTFYVDQNHPQASDDNSGTKDQPWLTIQHAADVASAGDTVIVKAGIYQERAVPQNSGAAGDRIIFKAQPRRSVTMWGFYTVNADYLRIEGFNITTDDSLTGWTEGRGVFIRSDYVEVVDNYFYDIKSNAIAGYWHEPFPQQAYVAHNKIYRCQAGIDINGTGWVVEENEIERLFHYGSGDCDYTRFFGDDHIIRNNFFHGTNFDEIANAHVDCFQTFTNNGEHAHNILFEGNVCYDFHQALMASNVNNTATSHFTFRNNLFARGHAWGLCVHDISYITAENNTFADIAYHGAGFRGNSIGNVIRNNIFYDVSTSYWASDGAQVSGDYNLIFDAGEPSVAGPHDLIGVDPLFVDPVNHDFHLRSGSPAIDAGQALGQVRFDLDQVARPQGAGWDIGAYEFAPALALYGTPADRAIHLTWTVNTTMPVTSTWRLAYDGPSGDQPSPITAIVSPTRAYTLTGLTNYTFYTVTLNGMLASAPFLTDTVTVMPTDIFVYLPLVLKGS
jgi:hypothetical protein